MYRKSHLGRHPLPQRGGRHPGRHRADARPLVDEIVVVNNASTDRTEEVALALGAKVVREENKGYGNAYKAGLAAAGGDIIVTMDGDGTYPPDAIQLLLLVSSRRRWTS